MKTRMVYLFIALAFLVLAALLRFWIAPLAELLPVRYTNEVNLSEETQFRDSPTGEWLASALNTRRVDQTISTSRGTSIIEGGVHIYSTSGAVNFESTSLYGVDRRTRLNLAGYGSVSRTGQYLFPPHVSELNILFGTRCLSACARQPLIIVRIRMDCKCMFLTLAELT
jgi:hypothetical protein